MNDDDPRATRRLFLALWPPPNALSAVLAWRSAWQWPERAVLVPPPRMHLTLHFIGPVPLARLADVEAGLDRPCECFEIEFGRAAAWPGGLALLVPHRIPDALRELHATLAGALKSLDLPVESRAFRPHLTLARKAEDAVPPAEPANLRWPVGGYSLVVSDHGYRTLRRYRSATGSNTPPTATEPPCT